jgi:L-threonylcarbamoyladenylate synthase
MPLENKTEQALSASAQKAVAAIRAGRPVVLPLDTVYGLCASPYREETASRVYRLKGRPESSAIALVCSDLDMVFECVPELRGRAGTVARALLPGPYTLIFPNPARRYRWLTGSNPETIGIRVPALTGEVADVLGQVGAVMATSANLAGGRDPRRPEDVPEEIRSGCAAFLSGGELPGIPSTVLDLTASEPVVVREGVVPAAEALAQVERALTPASG